ncbi:MAG TPA: archaeal heat shock protein Hsp20 [Myxococcota bacterium]|nr:archaeal heat shock protein Hsp20 [Myxococcota bacterium]
MVRKSQPESGSGDVGLGGIFRSLGGFLDLLSNLAEKGEGEFKRSGELGDEKKGVKAVYGFSVRIGGGGKPLIEKFGNVKDKDDGQCPVVEEAREPMVDMFDEGDHLLVVAELPGVDANDVRFEVKEDVLSLSATRGDRKYLKEVLLSSTVRADAATSSYRNGVFEIKLPKAD